MHYARYAGGKIENATAGYGTRDDRNGNLLLSPLPSAGMTRIRF